MSEEGEKTCPLCAEEMDLTDQQLKPCKCGYEICVWCWHHIMDMAEKDNTEGRCPACRTPYNKEKIVGTASNCERLVTGMSVEKKQKSQKGKTKTCEGRNQLGNVRVIQRNLVYIVGLPLNLADEDLLQQKEYFGQYGKVLKVSMSRTAGGAIQQFPNGTCSVYITYSKEEEAVRSIQSAHGFVLEGRPLRACFGTTKYCHAWLRNAPCTNADCLYLHELGPQEDSFTKDEIVSAYTRVQQITGATNEMQRRSGNLLPPPADDYSNNSNSAWGAKPISKSVTSNPANGMKVSPPNSSSGRPVALPAAASWGARPSNSQHIVADLASFKGPSKPQTDTFSSAEGSPLLNRDEKVKKHNEESHAFQEKNRTLSETPDANGFPSSSTSSSQIFSDPDEGMIRSLSDDMASVSISKNQRSQPCDAAEQIVETLTSNEAENTAKFFVTREPSDLLSDSQKNVAETAYVVDQNLEKASENASDIPVVNGYSSALDGYVRDTKGGRSQMGIYEEAAAAKSDDGTVLDLGESSIISNILSMDFDPWDESLTSPQNLAKFLGESDKQPESHRVLSSRKAQNSNQSRFSFARQDECTHHDFGRDLEYENFNPGFVSNNSIYHDDKKLSYGNRFSSFTYEESDKFASNYSPVPENKISVSRAQVSAPPGFSGPSRVPPPGFTSHERMEQTFDNISGNHMLDNFSLLRKAHQAPTPVNIGGVGDMEFMDPAILAVGNRVPSDRRSNFPAQSNSFENDAGLQLLMQRSFSQQNPRFTEPGDNYSQQTNSYRIPSRMVEQAFTSNHSSYQQNGFQQPRSSMMSNGHWNGWNEFQGGKDIAMAEMLRNERLGFNKYYSGHEDATFQLSTSGDLYNRTFGI